MQLTSVTLYRIRIPFKKPFKHASATRSFAENIVIRCQNAEGVAGWGETIAREYVTGESTTATIERYTAIPKKLWQTNLITLDDIDDFVTEAGLTNYPVARCGLETALLDMMARAENLPLFQFLSAHCPDRAPVCNRGPFFYGGAIGLHGPIKTCINAVKMRLFSFKKVKLKLEHDLQADRKRLKICRTILGPQIDLRVDANEAWDPQYAAAITPYLDEANVSAVEQPFPKDTPQHNKSFRNKSHIPLILDESLCTFDDAQRAVKEERADLFCIKLPKTGGFLPALKLIDFASKQNIFIQLSCQVGESAILSAAGRHVAALCRNLRYLEGSFDRYLLRQNISREDISFGYGGKAALLKKPGLGITIDQSKLDSVAEETISLVP